MEAFAKIDAFWGVVISVTKKIAACLLLVMTFVVSIQVVGRICKFTIPWTEEVGTYTLIWMTFIGSVAVLAKGEHLTVDLFLLRYKPRQKRVAMAFIYAFVLAFCAILFTYGVRLCQNPVVLKGRTPALAISRVWIYLSLPISMFFNSLYALCGLIRALADLVTDGKVTAMLEARKEGEKP